MRVTDVMSTSVRTVDARETIARALATMKDAGVHHLVVLDGGRMTGLVSADRLERGDAEGILRVENVMCRRVRQAALDTTLPEAAALLRGDSAGALPIVKDGRIVGIVTASDLLEWIARGGRVAPTEGSGLPNRRRASGRAVVSGVRAR